MGVVRSRTSYNNHNTMTTKGWVSRKREQFESFAKSVDDQNNVLMTVAKPQPNLQNVGYKPPQEDVKIKASEVTTVKESDALNSPKEIIKDSIKNIRDEAIRQSSKPSGSVEEETSVVEDDVKNDNINTNAGVPTINNNNSQKMQPQKQQQVTKKMVYTQYREMLKRYEQSSRL